MKTLDFSLDLEFVEDDEEEIKAPRPIRHASKYNTSMHSAEKRAAIFQHLTDSGEYDSELSNKTPEYGFRSPTNYPDLNRKNYKNKGTKPPKSIEAAQSEYDSKKMGSIKIKLLSNNFTMEEKVKLSKEYLSIVKRFFGYENGEEMDNFKANFSGIVKFM